MTVPDDATTVAVPEPTVVLPDKLPAALVRAVCAVMAELPAIGKGDRSPEGYSYRGIESITKHAQMLMAKHLIMIVPNTSVVSVEPSPFMKDGWQDVYVSCDWMIYGPDGIGVPARTVGIGRDKADKGANKGQTQAFKYLLLALFMVADKADDSDGQTYEDERGHATAPPRGRGQQQQRRGSRTTTMAADGSHGGMATDDDTDEQPPAPAPFDWNAIGWNDKAEHDQAMLAVTQRTAELDGIHPGFRDHVAARWRADGKKLPLAFDDMAAWQAWLEQACVEYVAGKVAAATGGAEPAQPRKRVGARAQQTTADEQAPHEHEVGDN